MIYDNIKNISRYFALGDNFKKALEYLSAADFMSIENGEYEINGKDIYAIVNEYQTKPLSAGKWESHKKYADIQFIVSGIEKMGFTETKKTIVLAEYDEDKDVTFHKGEGQFINVEEKHFVIFFPNEIHMPSLAVNIPKQVKKVVLKVAVD